MINTIQHGLALDVLKKIPDDSINCVITSPPYWQLRNYGFDEQWGLEPTFEEYLENLNKFMKEVYRVLKKDGTAWINLGDSYGTVSGNMKKPDQKWKHSYCGESLKINQSKSIKKCLLLIPHRFAINCIENGWILRNDIVWAKRNAMPEPVKDRFTKKHEYIFLFSKSEKYYFDIDSVRLKHQTKPTLRDYSRKSSIDSYPKGKLFSAGIRSS